VIAERGVARFCAWRKQGFGRIVQAKRFDEANIFCARTWAYGLCRAGKLVAFHSTTILRPKPTWLSRLLAHPLPMDRVARDHRLRFWAANGISLQMAQAGSMQLAAACALGCGEAEYSLHEATPGPPSRQRATNMAFPRTALAADWAVSTRRFGSMLRDRIWNMRQALRPESRAVVPLAQVHQRLCRGRIAGPNRVPRKACFEDCASTAGFCADACGWGACRAGCFLIANKRPTVAAPYGIRAIDPHDVPQVDGNASGGF